MPSPHWLSRVRRNLFGLETPAARRAPLRRLHNRTRPVLERMEERLAPATLWVDNSPGNGGADFTSSGGSQPTLVPNVFPYSTISAAVAAATNGDTINVADGTYPELVNVSKSLTIQGNQFGVDARTRSLATETIVDGALNGTNRTTSFYITVNNVTIDGFTVTGQTDTNQFGAGIVMASGTSGVDVLNNIVTNNEIGIYANSGGASLIQHNLFDGNNNPGPAGGTSIYSEFTNHLTVDANKFINQTQNNPVIFAATAAAVHQNLQFTNNALDNPVVASAVYCVGITGGVFSGNNITTQGQATGIRLGGADTNITITNNNIYNVFRGVGVLDDGYGLGGDSNVTINLNSITNVSGAGAVDVTPGFPTVNASGNWWNTTLGATPTATTPFLGQISALTSGPVHVGSFLDSGSNAAMFGFTPQPGTEMWVPQTAATTLNSVVDGNIQDGIDTAVSGMTVRVAADTYIANSSGNPGGLDVTKPLTLLGSQAGVDARTRSGSETIVHPGASNPNPFSPTDVLVVYVASSNVTIDGFTVDGDNPGLTSGVVYNGADIDAAEGIVSYQGVGNITVQNNIIRNTTYTGIDFDNYNNNAATSNNFIRYNLIQNLGGGGYGYGLGVLLYDNFYAAVTNNAMNSVRVGVQTGNFSNANPGGAGTAQIANNQITAVRRGIFYNLHYSNASPFTVSGNTISAVVDATSGTKWDGVLISSQQGAVSATFSSNQINGSVATAAALTTAGYEVWNTPTVGTLLISGGSVTGVNYGVWVNTYEGYGPSNAAATQVTVSGLSITANQIGVWVEDSPANTNHPAATATIQNNTAITTSGAGTGILVSGTQASAVIQNNASTITGNFIGIDVNGGSASVTANTITANGTGIRVKNGGVLTSVANNFITNQTIALGTGFGISIEATAGTNGAIFQNDLSGNATAAINNASATLLNASANWYGFTTLAGVTAQVGSNVDFTPWLQFGTDMSPAAGFQADFSYLDVSAVSPQAGATGRIQEAINLIADGSLTGGNRIVNLTNGLYIESNTTVTTSVTIQGQSQLGVTIAPAGEDDNLDSSFGGTYQHGFIVQSSDVTIQDLTIDGQGNVGLTAGKNNFRAGVITDFSVGPNYSKLTVQNLTVKNIYRRGIQVSTNGTGNVITGNTLSNIGAAAGALAIAVFGGDTNITNNQITGAVEGIGANANFGPTQYPLLTVQGNTISGAGVGMNLAAMANGSLVGGTLVAQGNSIDLTTTGTYTGPNDVGILVSFAPGTVTVENNQITASQRDSALWLFRDEVSPVLVLNNTFTASSAAAPVASGDSAGIFLSDNPTPFGENNTGGDLATIQGNSITGFYYGIDLERTGTNPPWSNGPQQITVTIGGPLAGDNNVLTGPGTAGSTGIRVLNDITSAAASFASSTIQGNTSSISGFAIGIDVDGGSASVTANTITANGTGIRVKNGGVLTSVANNFITNQTITLGTGYGISIEATAGTNGAIFQNDLSGNATAAINNASAMLLDASANWYGITTLASVAAQAGSNVDFTPWLQFGTDMSPAAGFQADFSDLNVSASSPQSGATGRIQEAINLIADGSLTGSNRVVNVLSGTYIENPTVNKPLILDGPNAGIAGNSLLRGAEATLYPAVNDPVNGSIIDVESSGVTIDGLLLNGDNPFLGGGTLINGADVNAGFGILNSPDNSTFAQIDHLRFQNNVLKNFAYQGVYLETAFGVNHSWNYIQNNLFDNMKEGVQAYALHTDISNNTMTRVTRGVSIHGGNTTADVGFTPQINNNNISLAWSTTTTNRGVGIWVNYRRDNASPLTVSGNTITMTAAAPSGDTWFGIYGLTMDGGRSVTFSNNTITGNGFANIGYYFTATDTPNLLVTGGSVSGVTGYGVLVKNTDSVWGPGNAQAVIDNVSISVAAGGVGVAAIADSSSTDTASVTLQNGVSITGASGSSGLDVEGATASASVTGASISGFTNAITGVGFNTLSLTNVSTSGNTSGGTFTGSNGTVNLTAAANTSVSADMAAGALGDAALQTIGFSGATLGNLNLGSLGNGNTFNVKPVNGGTTTLFVDGGTPFPPGSTLNLDLSAVTSPVLHSSGPGAGSLTATPGANPLSWVHINNLSPTIAAIPGHNYHVFRSGLANVNLEVDDVTTSTPVFDAPYASVTTLTINGTGTGANQVNVDFAGATNPIPSGGITFNGVPGTNNLLTVTNGAFTTVTSNYTGAHSGNVVFAGLGTVSYTGLRPVDMTGSTMNNLVLNLPTGAQAVLEAASPGNDDIRSLGGPGFELTSFPNPSSSLTINTAGSSSLVQLAAMDGGFAPATENVNGLAGDIFQYTSAGAVTSVTAINLTTATLDLNAISPTIGALTGNGSITNSSTLGTLTVTGGGSFAGPIAGAFTALTVAGTTQTLTLSGNDTYGGTTTINVGETLKAGSTTAFSPNSSVSDAGTLDLAGFSNSIGALNGGGLVINSGLAATLTVTGGGSFSGNVTGATTALTVGGTTQTLNLSGNNTFSGLTTINSGDTLQAGSGTALTANTSVADSGTLDLNGNSITINGLTGTGIVDNTAGAGTYTLTVGAGNATSTFSGTIQNTAGTLALTKSGTGAFRLAGAGTFTFTGAVNANGGVLVIDGSLATSANAVTVGVSGTLGGFGTLNRPLIVNGTVSPGDSGSLVSLNPTTPATGILNTGTGGNVTFNAGSTFFVDLTNGGTAGTNYDQLNVTGTVTLSGLVNLTGTSSAVSVGREFKIINNDLTDTVSGIFNGVAEGGFVTVGGVSYNITYAGGDGNDVVLSRIGHYDFNDGAGSPTAPGYQGVNPSQVYTPALGAGWNAAVSGYNRGTPANPLLQDGNWGGGPTVHTFKIDVVPGVYQVTPTLGDTLSYHDNVQIFVGDSTNVFSGSTPGFIVTTPQGQFYSAPLTINVTTGQLWVNIDSKGAYVPYWIISALDVRPSAAGNSSVGNIVLSRVTPGNAAPPAPLTTLQADGMTVDTYAGTGAPPSSIITLTATTVAGPAGSITEVTNTSDMFPGTPITDASTLWVGIQVQTDPTGAFMFRYRRPTGTAAVTFTAQEVSGLSLGTVQQPYQLPQAAGAGSATWRLDFNAATSPTAAGYLGVQPTNYISDAVNAIGWVAGGGLQGSFDRGAPNALLQDGHYGYQPASFRVDVPTAGSYQVTATLGDQVNPHGNMTVQASGAVAVPVNTAAGQFASVVEDATTLLDPSQGNQPYLLVTINSTSPYTPWWVINALDVRPLTATNVATITISGNNSVPTDGLNTDTYTGSGAPANALVTLTTTEGAITAVSPGLTLSSPAADASATYQGVQVLTDASGNFSFKIQRPTGIGTGSGVITAYEVSGLAFGTEAVSYVVAPTRRFDFITTTAPTAAGFIGVLGSATYTTTTGFGWLSQPGDFDRGAGSSGKVTDALYRDGNWGTSTTPGTYKIQVAPGTTYNLRAYVGDPSFGHGSITVTYRDGVGGSTLATYTIASLAADQFDTTVRTVTPTTSTLAVTFSAVNSNPYWVVNGLDVWTTTDPGQAPELAAAGEAPGAGAGVPALTQADLAPVVKAAIADWKAAGINAAQLALLQSTQFQITTFGSGVLAQTGLGVALVKLDATAAGWGWFIGPNNSAWTRLNATEELAKGGSAASGHMDLLTVVEHELGHVLGMDDLRPSAAPYDLMSQTLPTGVRRLPDHIVHAVWSTPSLAKMGKPPAPATVGKVGK